MDLPIGNTEVIAKKIQTLTQSDIFEIKTAKVYPIDYTESTIVAKDELRKNATMNVNDEIYVKRGFKDTLERFSEMMSRTLGNCELLSLTNTVQIDNYSKYVYQMADQDEKFNHVEKISAVDLQKAFDLGVRLIKSVDSIETYQK